MAITSQFALDRLQQLNVSLVNEETVSLCDLVTKSSIINKVVHAFADVPEARGKPLEETYHTRP
jgi:hypothetical protein